MAKFKSLSSGFTGELEDPDSFSVKARHTAGRVRNEAAAVAQSAQDHPSATGAAVLVFGAAAFIAGYILGSRSGSSDRDYW